MLIHSTHWDHLWVFPTQRKRIRIKICLVDSQYWQRRGGEGFGAPLGSLVSLWDHRGRVRGLTSCCEPPHCKGGPAPLLLDGAATPSSSVPSSLSASRPDLPQQPLAWTHTVDSIDRTPASLKRATPAFLCKFLYFSLFSSPAEQLRYSKNWQVSPKLSIRPCYN